MSQSRSAASIRLLRQALARGQSVRLKVISRSMEPLLQIRDTIVIVPLPPDEITRFIGEIVTFESAGELFTHRLIRWDGQSFQTAADRTGAVDPPLPPEAILGRVIARERREESLALTSGVGKQLNQQRFRAVSRLIHFRQRLPPVLQRPVILLYRLISTIRGRFY